jgi:predicted O-methyltransferase YrrM
MSEKLWTDIDRYFTDLFASPDPELDAVLAACEKAGLPPVEVTPLQGKLLMILARLTGARRILEIGTLGGYSAIWLARGLAEGGKLITLESRPKHAEVARENFRRAGLSHVIELRLGRALETLPKIAAEGLGPFDLVFVDADKAGNPDYFTWALKLTRRGSLIILDNVVREGRVLNAKSTEPNLQGIRRCNAMMAAEPRISATALQTVGAKGHDGIAIALVVADR